VQITASQIRAAFARCPICGPSVFIKLAKDEMAVRCLRCRASPVSLSLVIALRKLCPNLGSLSVYELSSRGAVVKYLRRCAGELCVSEFFDDVEPGTFKNGIQCQDVQALKLPDESFDVCTSTEVFEHVPDDLRGFAEVRRVLRPGGIMLLTVPLSSEPETLTRALLRDGVVTHLLPPEYHGDRICGAGKVLTYRNYGVDILKRIRSAGFARAEFMPPDPRQFFGFGHTVVVGYR
jgi:SAM-dependent methyltransferase